MSVRLAPWEGATSDLAEWAGGRRSARVLSRVTAHGRPAGFWIGLCVAATAAEFGVLVPVILVAAGDRGEALDGRLHLSSHPGARVIAEIPCGS